MGAAHEQPESAGRGTDSDGTGVQLTLSDYFEIRPTDRENVSDSDTLCISVSIFASDVSSTTEAVSEMDTASVALSAYVGDAAANINPQSMISFFLCFKCFLLPFLCPNRTQNKCYLNG